MKKRALFVSIIVALVLLLPAGIGDINAVYIDDSVQTVTAKPEPNLVPETPNSQIEESDEEEDFVPTTPGTEDATPPQNTNLVLDLSFNGDSPNKDLSGQVHDATVHGATYDHNGGRDGRGAYIFDGNDYLEIADADDISPATTGEMTISFWVRVDNTDFVGEGSHNDYLHYLGKGGNGNDYEYVFRQYNNSNDENRNDRMSFYHFNLEGGLGAGSYVQEQIQTGEWMHITGVIRDGKTVEIWKNGVLVDSDPLSGYDIVLQNGAAPLRIGTADMDSFFQGSIDDLKIYNKALSQNEIAELAR